jgi:hypothetical protein
MRLRHRSVKYRERDSHGPQRVPPPPDRPLREDQLSFQQTGKTVSQRQAEHAEAEDERFTRAWCAKHRMPAEDIQAYLQMDIDERARWRRDSPQKWRTSRITLALAARRTEARQRPAAR